MTFSWTFVSVPAGSAATLANPATATPTFVIDRPGAVYRPPRGQRRSAGQRGGYGDRHDREHAARGQRGSGSDGAGGHHHHAGRDRFERRGWRRADIRVDDCLRSGGKRDHPERPVSGPSDVRDRSAGQLRAPARRPRRPGRERTRHRDRQHGEFGARRQRGTGSDGPRDADGHAQWRQLERRRRRSRWRSPGCS